MANHKNQEGNQQVSVVIPAYNEEESISRTLDELSAMRVIDEIIVVDDGSLDRTAEIVRKYECARLLQHPYNIGNGAALKTGLRAACGDIIVVMDGDGQHPPADIPKILAHMDRYDMVVAARAKGTQSQRHRDLANKIFNSYASYIAGNKVEDLTSGFRAIRAEVARQFIPILPNKYSSPSTLTIACFRSGYTVKYQPFVSPKRIGGSSSIKTIRDGFRFLLTITRMGVLFSPLRIFLPVGLSILIVSLSYTIAELAFSRRFSGFGGLMITISIFILLFGLVSEQIALLRLMKK